jgi:multidrug resistance efflux pump
MSEQPQQKWGNPPADAARAALDRVFGDRDRQQQQHNAELAHARAEAERLARDWPLYHRGAMERQSVAAAEQATAYQQQIASVQQQLADAQASASHLAAEKAAREAHDRQLAEHAEVFAAAHRTRTFVGLLLGVGVGWLGWRLLFARVEARPAT